MAKKKISVSKKILADVGRGIYRSPANAIKELVSNAFDACATWVRITTNAPYFDILTCEDNGRGMDSDEFEKILERIGSSTKRANRAEFIDCEGTKRPIIGKIGIGLLAVSQICDKFTVISKKKGERKLFEAAIDLMQFEKDDAYFRGEGEIALGEYEMEIMPAPDEEIPISYTRIIMTSLRKGFQEELKDERKKQIIRRPKGTASEASDFVSFVRSLHELKHFKSVADYDFMVWELGLLCPTRYLKEDAEYLQGKNVVFPSTRFVKEDIERLDDYKFRLFVDGLEVYKPILFLEGDKIKNENEDFKVYFLPQFDEEVAGEQLKFHGYIYTQRVKITPIELQGILIRIKDVAIGNHDKSILKYPREEGPIFSMISGEVFVENGLENALNIDRNSFSETHPHYQELRSQIHKFIKEQVVQDIRKRSSQRREREKSERVNQELKDFSEKMRNDWGVKITFQTEEQPQARPYPFKEKDKEMVFFMKARGWAKSEKERLLQMKSVSALSLIKHSHDETEIDDIISDIVFGRK